MPQDHPSVHSSAIIEAHRKSAFFSPAEADLVERCVQAGQNHLFARWNAPGTGDETKRLPMAFGNT